VTHMDDKGKTDYNAGIADLLDKAESAIYLLVALFLGIMALMTFFVIARELTQFDFGQLASGTSNANLTLINGALNDVLVTLIIAGLIQTVIVYIKIHTLDLRLILGVGLTAMIRQVLVSGVESVAWQNMAVTALLILVIIVGIFMIGDAKVDHKKHDGEKEPKP
jgi:uncharacterized membrane protein (DUF373 family)